jgi:hypothetical protein
MPKKKQPTRKARFIRVVDPLTVGPKGDRGPRGFKGDRGPGGFKGDKGEEGERGLQGWSGGGGGRGPAGPPGPPGGSGVPQSATLTRDSNGAVQSVTVEGESAWVIDRNPDGSVAGLSNAVHDVAVDRDEDDVVEGITVTEL